MPVVERRKVNYDKQRTPIVRLPKGWARMFGYPREADLVIDTPVVFFSPNVKTNKERAEALRKIINILENVPEPPYPVTKERSEIKRTIESSAESRGEGDG